SKPFKTIQNAVNAFIGTGTADNPQFAGGAIIIQRGNTYGFTGNWSIRDITIVVEEGVIINHTPSSGMYLVDYDSLNENAANFELNIREGAQINLNERGFRNRGSSGGSATPKTITIRGGGTINMGGTYSSGYYIIESNTTNIDGYLMTPVQQFEIEGVELR